MPMEYAISNGFGFGASTRSSSSDVGNEGLTHRMGTNQEWPTRPQRRSTALFGIVEDGRLAHKIVQWRREWDSNPRYGFPHTRFPSVRLKPLGHLSEGPSLGGVGGFLQAAGTLSCQIPTSN